MFAFPAFFIFLSRLFETFFGLCFVAVAESIVRFQPHGINDTKCQHQAYFRLPMFNTPNEKTAMMAVLGKSS